ncbi:MAG: hypothetical protein ILA34_01725 [Bacteroidaceae bacterium]|nr:hypothetical protein [Bacteroidaceae bacterium]
MKELNRWQSGLFTAGGLLLLTGAVMWPNGKWWPVVAYCAGALCFGAMQMGQRYEGKSITIRRLRRQQILGAVALMLAGAAMIANRLDLGYLQHNEWMAIMAIGALLECYTVFRIDHELKKEE